MTQHDEALRFHALHVPGAPLALANAWDVASARIVAATGASAVATTSAGVAWGLGAADGDHLARDPMLDLVRRVAAAVDVPVSADIESGFGATAAQVGETVGLVLAAGAVGVNIEDSRRDGTATLRSVDEQAERLAAARAAADLAGIPLYLNARVDVFLSRIGPESGRLDETLARAAAYLDAGASGVFVPGVCAPELIAALTAGIDAPVNVLVQPGTPSVAELARLGVARVSLGSAVAEAAYGLVQRAARELAQSGTYTSVARAIDFGELNELMLKP
ncbi:isocitrate lyase/phosphoenolpyruvate mutase family protein [Actinospica durhamensis]|uniref:Isocitrate lyase/phosphoenolpyruvate mutase family protein n=1 Tax=Actinospica durhamensis TaxID=1508375 RepID=A0A941ESI1_9ACTN|nr:isocitrate lyase/phosphoenolpyruvate mutase family protein [Actinospica durhamensis]MBR7836241.1 isocitrate lyase/phosphoenolpyruvate mutase family protein [Actinospica durhamensis]